MSTAELQPPCNLPQRIALMGVCGCGKTAVGKSLAARLGVRSFTSYDQPLDDADRWPWLSRIGRELAAAERPTIIGCSALKRAHRTHIVQDAGAPAPFIHLTGAREVIAARMKGPREPFHARRAAGAPIRPPQAAMPG